jgi:L-alanine-DL-glutamate epimerase-like enolase superfamily enzyme
MQTFIFSVPVNFKIALWDIRFSRHCVVVLNIDGVQGCGSGPLYKNRPLAAMRLLREEIISFLETAALTDLGDLRNQIRRRFVSQAPSLVYALDSALWDIQGRMEGKPVNQLLSTPRRDKIAITEQIFISNPHQARRELEEILRHGTKSIKVKLGRNPRDDVDLVRLVREVVGEGVALRVDINHAYTFEQAVSIGKELEKLNVLALEEPLRTQDWRNTRRLKEAVHIPIMLDESILSLADLREAIEFGAIDILNFKLTRIGGLTSALEYGDVCQRHGVKISVGCSEDLGPGMASILHYASIVDDLYSTEGVGPMRLGFDVVNEEFKLVDGFLTIPQGNGLGVTFNEHKLRDAARSEGFVIGEGDKKSVRFWVSQTFNKWYQRWFTLQCRLRRRFQNIGERW